MAELSERERGLRVWRREPVGLAACWVLIGLGACFAVGGAIASFAQLQAGQQSYAAQYLIFVVAGVVAMVLGWLYGIRPKVEVDDAAVTVTNPFRRVEIPWPDVDHASSHGLVVVVVRRSRGQVKAWATQPPRFLERRGGQARAELVGEINSRRR